MSLFGKNKEAPKTAPAAQTPKTAAPKPSSKPKETTYFGNKLKITGNVSGSGDFVILGSLDGEFDLKGELQVAEPANIKGTIKAADISVKGSVQGTISAAETVHLDSTARVRGRINCPKISMMEGARFDGDINMSGKESQPLKSAPAESPAVSKKPDNPDTN
jgi:cytoskeletal protein CcmA (bactofilin family)